MKRSGKGLFIGFLTVVMSLFFAIGCSRVPRSGIGNNLAEVSKSSISASLQDARLTVEWGAVQQATSYLVTYDNTTLIVYAPSTRAIFINVEDVSGGVTITIVAQADGYISSTTTHTVTPSFDSQQPSSNALAMPTGLIVNDGKLTWTAVANATSYTVSDGTITVTVQTPVVNLAANGFTVPESGSVTYMVIAKAAGYTDSSMAVYTYTPDGSSQPQPTQTLSAPTGLIVNNGILSWTAVDNATSYTISDGTKSVTVSSNSVGLAANGLSVPTSGSVTYTVVAHATGYNSSAAASYKYTPSVDPSPAPSKTLAMPTGFKVTNGKLTWTAVTNATSYTVSDGTKSITVNTNSLDLATSGLAVPTDGSVTYTVVAKASGYTDSAKGSYTYTVTAPTLATPSGLTVINGKLTWSAVANAASYTVSDGTKSVTATTNSLDLATSGLYVPSNGSVTYTVIAKASGYKDSTQAVYTYTVIPQQPTLATPSNLAISNGILTWTAVTDATSYTVSDGSKTVTVTTNSVNLEANGFIIPASGKATYTVVAHATDYKDSVAASYTHTYENSDQQLAYVTFGEYPQTLKDSSVTVGSTADSDGYYLGSDGERYAKVTATPYLQYTGFKVNFSNGNLVETGVDYYFKVEPIKWRVLGTNGDNSLLFCDSIIANGAYNNSEISNGSAYPSNYMYSDIRNWLNGNFYSVAFNSSEQQIIQTHTVDNSAESTSNDTNIYACENTEDNIFLLSASEISSVAYGFLSDKTEYDAARMLLVSDYARATGAFTSDSILYSGCGWWWLRSPIFDSEIHAYCGNVSGMVSTGKVTSAEGGIAPAMWVTTNDIKAHAV